MSNNYLISIDIGGTKTAFGLIDKNLQLINQGVIATNLDFNQLLNELFSAINTIIELEGITYANIDGISIASPGPLNDIDGILIDVATTNWKNIPIVKLFEQKFNCKVSLINDCNAAAIGEFFYGAGKGYTNMAYLSISTGIGGAIIIDNKLYKGKFGNAGEFGHLTIEKNGKQCACGKKGCLELYASGTAIQNEYFKLTNKALSVKRIFELINSDEIAKNIINKSSEYIGMAISSINLICEPDIFVIGGGVSNIFSYIYPIINNIVKDNLPQCYQPVHIVKQALSGRQNLLGAAKAFYENINTLKI